MTENTCQLIKTKVLKVLTVKLQLIAFTSFSGNVQIQIGLCENFKNTTIFAKIKKQ